MLVSGTKRVCTSLKLRPCTLVGSGGWAGIGWCGSLCLTPGFPVRSHRRSLWSLVLCLISVPFPVYHWENCRGNRETTCRGSTCWFCLALFFLMKSKTDLHPFDLFQPSVYELVRQPNFASLSIIVEDFVKDSGATFSGESLLLSRTCRFVAVFWERMFMCQLYLAEQDSDRFLILSSCFLGLNKCPGDAELPRGREPLLCRERSSFAFWGCACKCLAL